MADLVHFHGLHNRAYVVRPSGPDGDQCEVTASGERVDPDLLKFRGTARYLALLLRERGRGVPVIVSPSCFERGAV